jgi:RNA polymerase sigma factor (sigma-70 family)
MLEGVSGLIVGSTSEAGVMDERTANLLEQFHRGDRSAYGVLFERYRAPLERFIRCHAEPHLQQHWGVEDLLQETHVEALRSLNRFTYRRELSFFLWLCGIARRLVLNRCRVLRRRMLPMSYRIPQGGISTSSQDLLAVIRTRSPSPAEALCLRENLDLLAVAMGALSSASRQAIVLRYIEGHEGEQAAEILGITAGAFRVRVSRALVQLHDALEGFLGETGHHRAHGPRP